MTPKSFDQSCPGTARPSSGASLATKDGADAVRLERLEKAFGRLRSRHREVILLARVDGLTYAQIGRHLGLSVRQVERRLARAIYALDCALHPQKRPWWRFW